MATAPKAFMRDAEAEDQAASLVSQVVANLQVAARLARAGRDSESLESPNLQQLATTLKLASGTLVFRNKNNLARPEKKARARADAVLSAASAIQRNWVRTVCPGCPG